MDINLADVTLHIDETLDEEARQALEAGLRQLDGVVAVAMPKDKPHLMVVEYNPEKIKGLQILDFVKGQGVHAELIGL